MIVRPGVRIGLRFSLRLILLMFDIFAVRFPALFASLPLILRRTVHSPMSLSALPAVLIQSLMHALAGADILALALCSKWTHQCANSQFAWRECPPKYPPAPVSRGLRRWWPLSLWCISFAISAQG